MKKEEFKIGQRFRTQEDEGDGPQWFRGVIKKIEEDEIFVEFDDIPGELILMPPNEWDRMKKID